ncbi:MAG: AraC family transcriptional regulator [Ruminococcaceae bacterium]|nr:AraC family transcriptional regulator [Oscillospiraceae bacterium]
MGFVEHTIEQIAFDSGFSSRNHFCTVFKKHFGISPMSYRSQRNIYPFA